MDHICLQAPVSTAFAGVRRACGQSQQFDEERGPDARVCAYPPSQARSFSGHEDGILEGILGATSWQP